MIGGMGSDRHFTWQQSSGPHVRFGSKQTLRNVRLMSALESGRCSLGSVPCHWLDQLIGA
jgi:hypothetical protein